MFLNKIVAIGTGIQSAVKEKERVEKMSAIGKGGASLNVACLAPREHKEESKIVQTGLHVEEFPNSIIEKMKNDKKGSTGLLMFSL